MRNNFVVRNPVADDNQAELYLHFPSDHPMGNPKTCDNVLEWVTFFRRNLHRFVIDYLGIKLHLFQIIWIYLMGISQFIVTIASRAASKSFIIALYGCCRCILYPGSIIILCSSTKGQSKLLVSDKIEKELMRYSPVLRKEISGITANQNEVVVTFRNHSTIKVVTANDNARGNRSTTVVREECRQIKKYIDDSILSPFQIVRQTPYNTTEYYSKMDDLQEEPIDIYISSSWFDNGSEDAWMWDIVDQAFDGMMKGDSSCLLLAFDESVALKHRIKTQKYFQTEKKKQDPITWELEFLNTRLKENRSAFFTYSMLSENQRAKRPFYPRTLIDFKMGKKNPYDISKQQGEIRIVACDMAFIENKNNDNSIFSCIRLLPECTTYTREGSENITVDNGYRRIVCYLESIQGGDIVKQAIRIRELFEDFGADYLILDMRNAGVAVYDLLAKVMYDEERGVEYIPLSCMNDESIANRIKIEGALPVIYVVNATQKLNSDIALDFRRVLESKKVDLLVSLEKASEEILPDFKEYMTAVDLDVQLFYEAPFLETQALISETTSLLYEKKVQTGAIVISEQGTNRKDRYTSVSYGSYFASMLEKDLVSNSDDYEYSVIIN